MNDKILPEQKKYLRKEFIELRNKIPQLEQHNASLALSKLFCSLPQYKTSKNIATYFPYKGEISTLPIINALLKDNKNCYLPKMDLNKKCTLDFIDYDLSTKLINNKFNIPEPTMLIGQKATIKPNDLDIIIVPCVAFDRMMYRLGLGGGYYDKIIKSVRSSVNNTSLQHAPKIIGIAFAIQEVAKVPLEEWDMPLDMFITELEIIEH